MVLIMLELAKEEEQTLQDIFRKEKKDPSQLDQNFFLSNNNNKKAVSQIIAARK